MVIKGENLRLKVNNAVIAGAQSCSVHIAAVVEDVTSKDTTGRWVENEVVGLSWDLQTDALVVDADNGAQTAEELAEWIGKMVKVEFVYVGGTQNREKVSDWLSGYARVSDVTITAANRKMGTATVKLTGEGELAKDEPYLPDVPDEPVEPEQPAGVGLQDAGGVWLADTAGQYLCVAG